MQKLGKPSYYLSFNIFMWGKFSDGTLGFDLGSSTEYNAFRSLAGLSNDCQ
jgi:hypothetical protein